MKLGHPPASLWLIMPSVHPSMDSRFHSLNSANARRLRRTRRVLWTGRTRSIGLFAGLVLLAVALDAWASLRAVGSKTVEFVATGPAGLRIEGTTSALTVQEDAGRVTIRVSLENLRTGIDLRDSHLKTALDVRRHRAAELVVPRNELRADANDVRMRGKLRLHGRERDVSFRYTTTRQGNTIRVLGTVRILMPEFGIRPPSYLGLTVRDAVDVTVRFSVRDD